MSETRKITTFGVLLAAEFLTFLVVLPSLAPDIPSNIEGFPYRPVSSKGCDAGNKRPTVYLECCNLDRP